MDKCRPVDMNICRTADISHTQAHQQSILYPQSVMWCGRCNGQTAGHQTCGDGGRVVEGGGPGV